MKSRERERKILNKILDILYETKYNQEVYFDINDFAKKININSSKLYYYLKILESNEYIAINKRPEEDWNFYENNFNISEIFILEKGKIYKENGGYTHWSKQWNEWQMRLDVLGKLPSILASIIGITLGIISIYMSINNFTSVDKRLEKQKTQIDSLKSKISILESLSNHKTNDTIKKIKE